MSELYLKNKQKNNSNISLNESHQQESKNNLAVESETINTADDIESILVHDDYETNSANPANYCLIPFIISKAFFNCC